MTTFATSSATGGPDMAFFNPASNFLWSGVSGLVMTGLLGMSSQITDPIAQIAMAVGGLLAGGALFVNAIRGYLKDRFRMNHYKEPRALQAIPDSDDEIPTATGRTIKPKTMRSTRKKSE